MNPLVLGIISALVAGNVQAVHDMLAVITRTEPEAASDVLAAIQRGLAARKQAVQEESK